MNTTLISTTHHRIVKPIAFAMAVILIAALSGCTTVHELADSYDLTVSGTDGGSVVDPGEATFTCDAGEVVTLVAQADEGYDFVSWTGDVDGIDDVDAASTTITMRGDYSITANFQPVPGLTVSSTAGGSVTAPGQGVFMYDPGTVVELVAVADECYRFINWTGDVADPHSATTTITVASPRGQAVTANFGRLHYELTVDSTAGGSVSLPGEGTFTYDCGTRVNLAADPDPGYRFDAWTGDVAGIGDVHATDIAVTMDGDRSLTAGFATMYVPMVDAGIWHTVGLTSDGTVTTTGYSEYGQCDVEGWVDIRKVAGGQRHTVAISSNGTLVTAGSNGYRQCNVGNWTDIVHVDAGKFHTVGLKADGTVVATGWNAYGQCDVDDWTDIVQLDAGFYHTVGLRSDGTVLAVGFNGEGRLAVGEWNDIVQVAAGGHQSIGLRSDGTVLVVGRNKYGECNVDDWTDIVQVAGGCQVTVGLKSDGSVVAKGWNLHGQCNVGDWNDIVQVTAGMGHTVGLKSDGTVVAVGRNDYGQCDVSAWTLA